MDQRVRVEISRRGRGGTYVLVYFRTYVRTFGTVWHVIDFVLPLMWSLPTTSPVSFLSPSSVPFIYLFTSISPPFHFPLLLTYSFHSFSPTLSTPSHLLFPLLLTYSFYSFSPTLSTPSHLLLLLLLTYFSYSCITQQREVGDRMTEEEKETEQPHQCVRNIKYVHVIRLFICFVIKHWCVYVDSHAHTHTRSHTHNTHTHTLSLSLSLIQTHTHTLPSVHSLIL